MDNSEIIIEGFAGQDQYNTFYKNFDILSFGSYRVPTICKEHGTIEDWPEFDWPPVKIRITIERIT